MTTATAHTWLQAPWDAYIDALDDDPELAATLARAPFRALPQGNTTTLATMANQAGMSIEACADTQAYMASRGYIKWDEAAQGVRQGRRGKQ